MTDFAVHGFSGMLAKPYTLEKISEALRLALGS